MTFNSIIRRSATAQGGFFVGFAIIFAFFSFLDCLIFFAFPCTLLNEQLPLNAV